MKKAIIAYVFVLHSGNIFAQPKCPVGDVFSPSYRFENRDHLEAFNELFDIVSKKDSERLMSILSKKYFTWSFGAEIPGREGFIRRWSLQKPDRKTSDLWQKMSAATLLGGASQKGNRLFCFPRVATSEYPSSCDGFLTGVLHGKIAIREKPRSDAKAMALVQDIIVEEAASGLQPKEFSWRYINFGMDKKGYVRSRDIRKSVGWRGCIELRDRTFKLSSFVAGD